MPDLTPEQLRASGFYPHGQPQIPLTPMGQAGLPGVSRTIGGGFSLPPWIMQQPQGAGIFGPPPAGEQGWNNATSSYMPGWQAGKGGHAMMIPSGINIQPSGNINVKSAGNLFNQNSTGLNAILQKMKSSTIPTRFTPDIGTKSTPRSMGMFSHLQRGTYDV